VLLEVLFLRTSFEATPVSKLKLALFSILATPWQTEILAPWICAGAELRI
jgi:hypothetical protein